MDHWLPCVPIKHKNKPSTNKQVTPSVVYLQKAFYQWEPMLCSFCSDEGLCSKHQLWNSLQWPIYIINLINDTKLPFYTLPLTQHHSSFSTCNLCHLNLRICSCLACIYRVIDAHRKFGELEKCVRVAWITAESNSSFWELSKLPKCIHNSIYTQLKAWANSFITERQQGSAWRSLNCDRVQNSHNTQKKEINAPIGWSKTQHILYFGLS